MYSIFSIPPLQCSGFSKISELSDDELNSFSRMQNINEYNWTYQERYKHNYTYFINHEDIYPHYITFMLNEAESDNLYGLEIKKKVSMLYSTTLFKIINGYPFYIGHIYKWRKDLDIITQISNNNKIKFSIILGLNKKPKTDGMDLLQKYNNFLQKNPKYYNIIKAIDLYGFETDDNDNDLLDMTKQLNLNYSIHAGESLTNNVNNLKSILQLYDNNKRIRVGHALTLQYDDKLMQKYKDYGISIEACPLSNYILGYVPNISTHPAIKYINYGLDVCINSDNASIYNYDYVSYDWLFVLGLWNLNIKQIYNLCINSIKNSFFNYNEKKEMLDRLEIDFDNWYKIYCSDNKLEKAIHDARNILNTY